MNPIHQCIQKISPKTKYVRTGRTPYGRTEKVDTYGPHNKWRGIIKHHINKLTHSQSLMSEKMTFREVATRSPEAIKLSFELISHSLVSLSKLNDRQFMFFSHLWTHIEMLGTFNVSRTCPFNVLPVCAGLSGIGAHDAEHVPIDVQSTNKKMTIALIMSILLLSDCRYYFVVNTILFQCIHTSTNVKKKRIIRNQFS